MNRHPPPWRLWSHQDLERRRVARLLEAEAEAAADRGDQDLAAALADAAHVAGLLAGGRDDGGGLLQGPAAQADGAGHDVAGPTFEHSGKIARSVRPTRSRPAMLTLPLPGRPLGDGHRPLVDRIAELVADGPRTYRELAEALGAREVVVRAIIARDATRFRRETGPGRRVRVRLR